ncbi:MAG: hypothetical protein ACYSTX_06585, partial [Planctomycetota bacterium]
EIEFGAGEGFREIAMNQLYACIKHSNVEFRGGFYTHMVTKDGTEKEIYTPDTRDSYCNSIYALALIVIPRFDSEMNKKWEKYHEVKKEIIEEFHHKTNHQAEVVLGEVFYESVSDKVALETLREKLLKLHHMLLKELSLLFSRKNYFGMGAGID